MEEKGDSNHDEYLCLCSRLRPSKILNNYITKLRLCFSSPNLLVEPIVGNVFRGIPPDCGDGVPGLVLRRQYSGAFFSSLRSTYSSSLDFYSGFRAACTIPGTPCYIVHSRADSLVLVFFFDDVRCAGSMFLSRADTLIFSRLSSLRAYSGRCFTSTGVV